MGIGPFRTGLVGPKIPTTRTSPCPADSRRYRTCPTWKRSKQPLARTIRLPRRFWASTIFFNSARDLSFFGFKIGWPV